MLILTLLLIGISFSSIFLAIILASNPVYRKFLFFYIPLVVVLLLKTLYYGWSFAGRPTEILFKEQFQLISYVEEKEKNKIYLWVYNLEEKQPINIVIPWSKKASEQLQKQSEALNKGRAVRGNFRKNGVTYGDDGVIEELREFSLNEILKKEK